MPRPARHALFFSMSLFGVTRAPAAGFCALCAKATSRLVRPLPRAIRSGDPSSSRARACLSTSMCAVEQPPQAASVRKRLRRENVGIAKAVLRSEREPWAQILLADNPVPLSGLPDLSRPFTVLGIETSCDDTAAAVVRSDGAVLGEAIASQHDIHEKWGGVVPMLARDAHAAEIDRVVATALTKAGCGSAADVDAIAVTVGPGLELCLRIGCERAKALAVEHWLPFVAVHHLEAHALLVRKDGIMDGTAAATATAAAPVAAVPAEAAAELGTSEIAGASAASPNLEAEAMAAAAADVVAAPGVEFPFLVLLVSGGHSQLLLCEGLGRYSVLGGTVDDAAGEAFDKVARILGLETAAGGGPAVEALAARGDPKAITLPVPMQSRKDCDLSFSGLKNAFRVASDRLRAERRLAPDAPLADADQADLAASFQNVAVRHLEDRVARAMALCEARAAAAANATAAIDAIGDGGSGSNVEAGADSNGIISGGSVDGDGGGGGGAGDVRRSSSDGSSGSSGGTGEAKRVLTLAMVGGVAANAEVRRRVAALCAARDPPWRLAVPPPRLCTDNGVMVAWAGVERLRAGISHRVEGQDVYARFPLGGPTLQP